MITAKNNPFATDRVLQIRYMPQTCTWDELLARLESMHYRAAIIGADGTGKTTLIEDIRRRLTEQGLSCRSIFVTMDISVPMRRINEILDGDPFDILLIDGADHLKRFVWHRIKRKINRKNMGLIITSHKPNMLPTLIECSTNPQLLKTIVTELAPQISDTKLIENLYRKHKGNIRDVLRELYDITTSGLNNKKSQSQSCMPGKMGSEMFRRKGQDGPG